MLVSLCCVLADPLQRGTVFVFVLQGLYVVKLV